MPPHQASEISPQVDIIHVALSSSYRMKQEGKGRACKESLSSLGIFSLGNGSGFIVIFLQNSQRGFKRPSDNLVVFKDCMEREEISYFFKLMVITVELCGTGER